MAKNDSLLIFGLLGALVLGAGGMALFSGLFKKNGTNGNGYDWFRQLPATPSALTQPIIKFEYPDLTGLYGELTKTEEFLSGKYQGYKRVTPKDYGMTTTREGGVLVSRVNFPVHESLEEALTGLRESRIGLESSKHALEVGTQEAKKRIKAARSSIVDQAYTRQKLAAKISRQASAIKRVSPWNPLNQ